MVSVAEPVEADKPVASGSGLWFPPPTPDSAAVGCSSARSATDAEVGPFSAPRAAVALGSPAIPMSLAPGADGCWRPGSEGSPEGSWVLRASAAWSGGLGGDRWGDVVEGVNLYESLDWLVSSGSSLPDGTVASPASVG
jgi:hypothetical protein